MKMNTCLKTSGLITVLIILLASFSYADWPVYMGNAMRNGASEERVNPGKKPVWVYRVGQKPSPGFKPETVGTNTGGPQRLVTQSTTFDYAFAPIIAGGKIYLPVSSKDALVCLDANTGVRLWTFYAEGAVRLAPAVLNGKVIFGSDDGQVYCIQASDGKEIWRYATTDDPRRIIANGRIASQSLVRTGVTVRDGVCYFASGLLPAVGGAKIHAVELASGKELWQSVSYAPPLGYILATDDSLIVPTGRSAPIEFDRKTGESLTLSNLGFRRQGGGAFIQQLDNYVVYGPTEAGILRVRVDEEEPVGRGYNSYPSARIRGTLTGVAGRRMTQDEEHFYILRGDELVAISSNMLDKLLRESADGYEERSKKRVIALKSQVQLSPDRQLETDINTSAAWKAKTPGGVALIRSGNLVFVGGKDVVSGFDSVSGEKRHELEVEGTAWELATSDGSLFVSTDSGVVYCFNGDLPGISSLPESPRTPEPVREFILQYAEDAIETIQRDQGYCLVLGLESGELVRALIEESRMQVIAVDNDPKRVSRIRDYLENNGSFGGRSAVHLISSGEPLPYPAYFANLIVSERSFSELTQSWPASEVVRHLTPGNGKLVFASKPKAQAIASFEKLPDVKVGAVLLSGREYFIASRTTPKGFGKWTHMFADASNTSCSDDAYVGGLQYAIQWIGAPDPSALVGWHADGMSPIYNDGRLYIMKKDLVQTVDAFNGSFLWEKSVPDFYRTNPGRIGGSACVDANMLYLAAGNQCLMVDVRNGETVQTLQAPGQSGHWGYLAIDSGLLLGTVQHTQAADYPKDPLAALKSMWRASEPLYVVSDTLFATDVSQGAGKTDAAWEYGDGKRRILNSTVTVGDGAVYFIEGRGDAIMEDADASMRLRDFYRCDPYLVSLDLQTGEKLFEKPFAMKMQGVLYLSYRDGKLIATSSYLVGPKAETDIGAKAQRSKDTLLHYLYRALNAETGEEIWSTVVETETTIGTQHNYNVAHPVVTKEAVWHNSQRTSAARIDIETGSLEVFTNRRDKGCSMTSGSNRAMFYRSLGIATFDFSAKKQEIVSSSNRPSCWLSILPAGGLLLMPEGSIGCNCAFPLQTSIALMPLE